MGLPPGFGSCEPGDPFCTPPPVEPPSGWGIAINIGGLAVFGAIITRIIDQVYKLIASITALILRTFRTLGKFLLHVWQNYVKKAITWLASHYQKLRAWLKRTITPIIKRLEKIKKWYDTHVLKQQLRTLQMIQTIRRFLGILRIFHVTWAAKLDATLADMQNRIEQSIAIVRGTLNQIVNTLALVLDPALLITRNVLGASLLTHLAAIKRIFAYGYHGPLTASETTFLDNNVDRYHTKTANSHIAALASSSLTDYDKSELAACRVGISGATGMPPVL